MEQLESELLKEKKNKQGLLLEKKELLFNSIVQPIVLIVRTEEKKKYSTLLRLVNFN